MPININDLIENLASAAPTIRGAQNQVTGWLYSEPLGTAANGWNITAFFRDENSAVVSGTSIYIYTGADTSDGEWQDALNWTEVSGSGSASDGDGWTGATYDPSTGVITFTSDDGLGFVTGDLRGTNGIDGTNGTDGAPGTNGSDGLGWTSGSYDAATGLVTFVSNDGLGFTTSDLRGSDGSNGTNGTDGDDGLGYTGGSYNSSTGIVTFTSDDAIGFSTTDLRGADGTSVALKGSVANFASLPSGASAGDLYITTDTGDGYVSDGSTGWTNVGPIQGPQGDSASITLGNVSTGAAGTSVIITNTGNTLNAVFDFTIPQGDDGIPGPVVDLGGLTNVNTGGLADGNFLVYDSGNWVNTPDAGARAVLFGLSGNTDDFIVWDGSDWTAQQRGIGTLSDVDVTGLADGNILKWDDTNSTFEPFEINYTTLPGTPTLANVSLTGEYNDINNRPLFVGTGSVTITESSAAGQTTYTIDSTSSGSGTVTSVNTITPVSGDVTLRLQDLSDTPSSPSGGVGLQYDSVSGTWGQAIFLSGTSSIHDLNDVDAFQNFFSATGQMLYNDSTTSTPNWIPMPGFTQPTTGQVLTWNASSVPEWTNAATAPVASVNGDTGVVVLYGDGINITSASATTVTDSVNAAVSTALTANSTATGAVSAAANAQADIDNLVGGTTGQVFVKDSATDFDGSWTTLTIPPTAPVDSVNGDVGIVVLYGDDIDTTSTSNQTVTSQINAAVSAAISATSAATNATGAAANAQSAADAVAAEVDNFYGGATGQVFVKNSTTDLDGTWTTLSSTAPVDSVNTQTGAVVLTGDNIELAADDSTTVHVAVDSAQTDATQAIADAAAAASTANSALQPGDDVPITDIINSVGTTLFTNPGANGSGNTIGVTVNGSGTFEYTELDWEDVQLPSGASAADDDKVLVWNQGKSGGAGGWDLAVQDIGTGVPSDTGSTADDVLTTDGNGNYTWETPSGTLTTPTNLTYTASTGVLTSSTQNNSGATIPEATTSDRGLMSSADKVRFDDIPAATAGSNSQVLTTNGSVYSWSSLGLGNSSGLDVGTTSGTVAAGDDARLSDARTPTAHTHTHDDITDFDSAVSALVGTTALAYTGHLEAPVEKTYYLSPYTPAAQTATGLYAICDTGTCTVEFKSNGVSLGSINVTASTNTQATPSSTTIPASEDVIMIVTSVSACFNLRFALEYTQ